MFWFRSLLVFAFASALVVVPPTSSSAHRTSIVSPRYGFMDALMNAFSNQEFDDRRAKASHILVKTEAQASEIKESIDSGKQDAAKEFSTCPSAKNGGKLGTFEPRKMVPQFDAICFDETIPVGSIVGPVKTVFGYHIIQIEDRFENTVKSEGSSVF